VYYYQSGKDVIPRPTRAGFSLFSSGMTKCPTIMNNMQPSDAGTYTCERGPPPYCSVHGDVESGHLVTLTRYSEHEVRLNTCGPNWTRIARMPVPIKRSSHQAQKPQTKRSRGNHSQQPP
ncbi:V-set and immunoglobulin domain-containing protein 1-like protein, partial [Lates japonicus]